MDGELSVRITLSSLCRLYRNKRNKKESFIKKIIFKFLFLFMNINNVK